MRSFLLGVVLVVAAGVAWAAEPPGAANVPLNFSGDAKAILPASGGASAVAGQRIMACLSMRVYRMRKDLDRGSVIPANPEEVAFGPSDFDANNIVGYSTCQRAEKYAVKTTDPRPER